MSITQNLFRLAQALQTEAQSLITSCSKCQIHFKCAQSSTESDLKVVDYYTYLRERLLSPAVGHS
jgi:hypothetical protein